MTECGQRSPGRLEAVKSVELELEHDDVLVEYDSQRVSVEKLLSACEESGFTGSVVSARRELVKPETDSDGELPSIYVDALAKALVDKKPIVLNFTTAWCAPCQRLENETFSDANVKRLLARCELVKLDADEHAALISRYGVRGLPDVRLLSPDGVEVRRIVDFQDAESFVKELQELIDQFGTAKVDWGQRIQVWRTLLQWFLMGNRIRLQNYTLALFRSFALRSAIVQRCLGFAMSH